MIEQTALAEGEDCRFCLSRQGRRIMIEGNYGFAAWDRHPASEGHFLVIPYRHFSDYFDITDEEREELWRLVDEGKAMADEKHNPDGYNIGINVGKWAGQSIPHLHIHVIPRYKGDVENPKGGVRGVIPQNKLYTLNPD
jgi:diadenosine tetraphosphate (Ap4A) HIT family hydrolase